MTVATNGTATAVTAPPPTARRTSIRWIVAGSMVLLTAAAVVSVGGVGERNTRRALIGEMESRLVLQARNLAMVSSGALLTDVPEWTLLPLMKEVRQREPELAFIDIVDREGLIRADADVRRIGTRFERPQGLEPQTSGPALLPGETLFANRRLLVVSAPITDAQAHGLGTVWVGLARSAVERRLEAARRQQAMVLALFLVLGCGAAFAVSSSLLRPLAELQKGLERIGRGDLDTPLAVRDRTEIGALAGTVNHMARELKQAQRELIERERIAHEVELARRIQRSLLPDGRRTVGPFVIEGEQRAATEVGGDYYQVFDLPDGRLGIVIADVSGKGLGGALVTAMLHALLRATAIAHESPAGLLTALDTQLGGMLEPGTFVTMFYGILDPARGTMTFASAGHNPLLVLHAESGDVEWLRPSGAPLAALRGRIRARYAEARVTAAPGDVWIQYTDGISEAFAHADQSMFGLDRIAAVTAPARAHGARAVLDALVAEVEDWRGGDPQHDDDTLLVVSRELDAAEQASAIVWLERARAEGRHLALVASRDSAHDIDAWLAILPGLVELGQQGAEQVRLAVHEVSTNVAEHACGMDPNQRFDLWWVPDGEGCHFLLRDRGRSFRYHEWQPSRFSDPAVRRRGRGFGLDIVHRVMSRVEYYPGTREGNLTCLTFDPRKLSMREEVHESHR